MESIRVTGAGPGNTHDASRPLAGRRVVLTRPRDQAGDFERRVTALGGTPVVAPAIAIIDPPSWTAADRALGHLDDYDWVAFTSANGARAFADRARRLGLGAAAIGRRRIAAVGPATASVLAATVRAPDVVASEYGADALAEQMPVDQGARVLFPCGATARDALPIVLRDRGAVVDAVVVYRTAPGEGVPVIADAMRSGTADAVLFASASAVSFVARALDHPAHHCLTPISARRPVIVCIGPATAAAARTAKFEPMATARVPTQRELIDEVVRWFAPAPSAQHTEIVR